MRYVRNNEKPSKVTLRMYDRCKYDHERKEMGDYRYFDVIYYVIVSGEDAKMIAAEKYTDDPDDFNEYLELHFENGYVMTCRNSYFDIFIEDQLSLITM